MPLTTIEIRIRRFPNTTSLIADAILTSDDSAAPTQLARNAQVTLDLEELLALTTDPAAYGKALTAQLFADQQLLKAWIRARAYAATGDLQLRLSLDTTADDFHALRWETLRDPDDPETDQPIALNERVRLVRTLDSADLTPVTIPPRPALRALVVVSNPSDLDRFPLAEVDVEGEVGRARAALGDIPTTILGDHAAAAGRATLANLTAQLRDVPPIVILVAHGTLPDGQPLLWLEREDGVADQVPGAEFIAAVARLGTRPLLLILASCRSAGGGYGDTLSAMGPRLARIGVPAVLGFQGDVAMSTVRKLLPILLTELRRDGQIDRAVAAARASLGPNGMGWQAVLWMRTRDGRLWQPSSREELSAKDDDYHTRLAPIYAELLTWNWSSHRIPKHVYSEVYKRLIACRVFQHYHLALGACTIWRTYLDPFEELVHFVRSHEEELHLIESLDQILEKHLHLPIPRRLVADLQKITDCLNLPDDLIEHLYHRSSPDPDGSQWRQCPKGDSNTKTLNRVLRQLAKATLKGDQHPLLTFVGRLLGEVEPEVQSPLRQWVVQAADYLGIPTPVEHLEEPAVPPLRPASLLVVLDPDDLEPNRFSVDAWLFPGYEQMALQKRCSLEESSDLLEELLRQAVTSANKKGYNAAHLTIEIFLPIEALHHAVDQWKVRGLNNISELLGVRYSVVIRSQERIDPAWRDWLRPLWKEKWDRFQQCTKDDVGKHFLAHTIECTQQRLCAELFDKLGFAQQLIVHEMTNKEIFTAVINAGIPVAISHRYACGAPQQTLQDEIKKLLLQCNPSQIPETVRQWRRDAVISGKKDHLGYYLTLLWDDPDRVPPDKMFVAIRALC
jgi:hypothetical protein